MIFLVLGIFDFIIMGLSVVREPRRFLNVILLLVGAILVFLGIVTLTENNGTIQFVLMVMVFIMTPIILGLMALLLIFNGVVMLKREGRSLANLLSLLMGVAVLIGLGVSFWALESHSHNVYLLDLLWLGAILMVYFTTVFMAYLVYSTLYMCLPKRLDCDYILIHGCGLIDGEKISPLLRGRADKALKVYRAMDGRAKLVPSGGKGRDEKVSEAQAIKTYLLTQGVPEEDIMIEEASTTTGENLKNVQAMLDGEGLPHRYIFVTNNYHVFRTGLLAKALGMDAQGVGCATAAYYWPSAFIREYIAIMVKFKWVTIAIVLMWLVFAIITLLPF
ncbi:YdcF family protein [Eubacterium sp.]|uniref:YdcF family protein n=1 Tax=Eubacterium sp. TaxID=142586 RepID=UPI002FC5EF57